LDIYYIPREVQSFYTKEKGFPVRTTVTIDDDLFDELMSITGAETKAEAVRGAVEEFVRLRRKHRLLALRGEVEIADSLAELRELEVREASHGESDD
jgi:Arc/MetJ family transcription regulator